MLYDTHCHPYLAKEKSQECILENFFKNGGKYLNTIACDIKSSQTCIDMAKNNPGVYATIGIHPTHVLEYKDMLEDTISSLEALYTKNNEYIVAIGEIGLDYHWLNALSQEHDIEKEEIIRIQKTFFHEQIKLAQRLELPIIIHNRSSKDDVFEVLKRTDCKNFVFHCYSEDYNYAQKLIDFAPDCMLGFGGITTFKNAHDIKETVKVVPLKNIIIETDSPYLTPAPYRGKQENEPLFCKHVLSQMIDIREETPEEITQQIFKNSTKFFSI